MKINDAFTLLGLGKSCDPDTAKARWREMVKAYHPDVGGDPDKFQELKKAYDIVLKYLKNQVCPTCKGQKTIPKTHGFNSFYIPCPDCKYTGKKFSY